MGNEGQRGSRASARRHERPARAVYICYFGLREPLVQSQVLPYLREITLGGTAILLLTFEPENPHSWSKEERRRWEQSLADEGIRWIARRYRRGVSPLGALVDVAVGVATVCWAIHGWGARILHARAHVPLAMALLGAWGSTARLLFDFRGFVPDEYVEAGHWHPRSWMYRAMKAIERYGFRHSHQVVVLTHRVRSWILDQGLATPERISVIPCCVDVSRFVRSEGVPHRAAQPVQLVYAGSVTGLYLLAEMARFFSLLQRQRPLSKWRILTHASPQEVAAVLQANKVDPIHCSIERVLPADMPAALSAASIGLSFIQASWSKLASCPTKIPEYLAAGIPVVSSPGMGDMDHFLVKNNVGVVVQSYDESSLHATIEQSLRLADDPTIRERCRNAAREAFDLKKVGGPRYRQIYQVLSPSMVPVSLSQSGVR